MAKGNNQKLKLLYLARLFQERTDEQHGISIQDMIDYLAAHDIEAERKALYQDINELKDFGLDITDYHEGRSVKYQLSSREFELPELKLLVDSVQSSKFITERKSRALIKKLEKLASNEEAKQLQRNVILSGRIKTMNESIYYNVDAIHQAMHSNSQISFQYVQWDLSKNQVPRKDGATYQISPWELLWDNESYYMIGYDGVSETMKHYRVDKMKSIKIMEKEKRLGKENHDAMDIAKYTRALFGMFGGDEIAVTLLCENQMIGPILDRFGTDIPILPVDENHFRTTVTAVASHYFIGWIIGLGSGVKVIGPNTLVEAIQKEVQRLSEQYL